MNRGEPSDDLSKIRGESSVVVTLSLFHELIHVPNAHTGKLTPEFGTWGVAPRNPFFLVHSGGADTSARITGDSYKNDGEVNSTRRHSGMDVDPSGRDNHFDPGRSGDHSQERKRMS
ncbi:apocytochrome b [Capsicum annuum]|nr:apocytochrome b [Capsicum annuum]